MNFRELNLNKEYRSWCDDITKDFFNPVLKRTVIYKRAVGFFSSSAFDCIIDGIYELIENGGKIQIITSSKLSEEDSAAIIDGINRRNEVDTKVLILNLTSGSFPKQRLNILSNLIATGRLEIKIAELETTSDKNMFHEKFGLMYDDEGNVIAFSGSMNESANAFKNNYESIDVFTSWTSDADRVKSKDVAFDLLWNNRVNGVNIVDVMEAKSVTQRNKKNIKLLAHLLKTTIEKIVHAYNNPDVIMGVTTGLIDLNKITNGLQKSDLIILAARPSMGKTALALNIAVNATRANKVVAFFSLEMSGEQLAKRLLSMISGVNSFYLSTGNLTDEDINNLSNALQELEYMKLFIDDTSGLTLQTFQQRARQLKFEYDIDLIVIDYIQLMQGSKEFRGNRVQEVSEISRGLKSLAKELNIPILAVSQLSRNVEMRTEKKPQLSDLRESGSLEQDADIVMFLYRDEYYNRDDEINDNIAELIIAKNRNGPTAFLRLQFQKEIMRFGDLTRIYHEDNLL